MFEKEHEMHSETIIAVTQILKFQAGRVGSQVRGAEVTT